MALRARVTGAKVTQQAEIVRDRIGFADPIPHLPISVFFKQEKLLENAFSSNFQYFPGYFLALFSSIFAAIFFSSIYFSSIFSRRKLQKSVSSNFRPKLV